MNLPVASDSALDAASFGAGTTERASVDAAAQDLAAALAMRSVLHEPGQRERYRSLLERAITRADDALARAEASPHAGVEPVFVAGSKRAIPVSTHARSILAQAHAAKAEAALYGAGQLLRSAQRAPTRAACDDGWQRVAAIVAGADVSARVVATIAAALEREATVSAHVRAVRKALGRAQVASLAARQLLEERNDAYTFHADRSFSFGEGWHVAAAAVLAGVAIQVEPDRDGTSQAETFLRAAGLGERLQPYRSRPRAMKQTTELVARAFATDPASARARLRAAFLGDGVVSSELAAWVDARVQATRGHYAGKKVLLWIRDGAHHADRNTTPAELRALTDCVQRAGLVPVWTGDSTRGEPVPDGTVDTTLFWKDPLFGGPDKRRVQLSFFEYLRARHGLVGQLGVTTAGMDGPALLGLPTLYLTHAPNVRMGAWVGAVPGYREIVRESGYLDQLTRVLAAWGDERAP